MTTPSQIARHVPDSERRARLAQRHALTPEAGVAHPVEAARAVTALHATEAATVHLSCWARSPGISVDDVDDALYDERSLVKQLAMRRTLFAFPRELLPAALGSASARVAAQEERKLAKEVAAGLGVDGETWLSGVRDEVLGLLDDGERRTAVQIRSAIPALDWRSSPTPDSKWGAPTPIGPRVLTWLGARGEVTRGPNSGHWRTNRPTWTTSRHWLDAEVAPLPEAEGYAALVGSWLRAYGPGTEADIVWWLGATKSAVRGALRDLDAVAVSLAADVIGWLLPDDLDPVGDPGDWAALLPTLDPTTMGWKERDFYLDPDQRRLLFDSNGNGGSTAWWNGRIVGTWVQDEGGEVSVVHSTDPGAAAKAALRDRAEALTRWLDGTVITNVYKSALMKGERLP